MKGNGLCHGITGNTYPFLTLAKATKDNKWLIRAHQFATLSFHKVVLKRCESASDSQRKVQGMPDRPYSLMEGMAGDIMLYADLIEGGGLFPAYEV